MNGYMELYNQHLYNDGERKTGVPLYIYMEWEGS